MSQEQLSELGQAALAYAAAGFAVFPVKPRSKVPRPDHGFKEWTKDPERIKRHWTAHPNDNIGITCGTPSNGLLVLDLDVKESANGIETMRDWERTHGGFEETAVSITGSGGRHYLFTTDRDEMRQTTNPTLGVDTRINGYIVAPPSINQDGNQYEWWCSPFDVEIAPADGNVYDFIDYITRNGGTDATIKKPNGKFQLPDVIPQGQRDETLFKYACSLRAIGRSDEEIAVSVAGVNATRCKPPVDQRDIDRIVRSACKYEQGSANKDDENGPMPQVPHGGGDAPVSVPRGPRGGILHNALAKTIIDHNHARIIDGAPAVWAGTHWEYGIRAINRCCIQYADDCKKQDKAEVASYILDQAPSVSSDSAFDGLHYVQFSNCTYCVETGEEVTPDPSMFITYTLPVALNWDVEPNIADQFLHSVAAGDEPTEEALKQIIGACMCPSRILSQSPMLIGTAGGAKGRASNGKSTFLNYNRGLLGPSNVSSLDIETMGQRFQAARVLGKAANFGDDIPDGFLKGDSLSTFKKVVTGDSIYTDVKGGDGFEFRPTATMVFSMNTMPRLSDTTEGIFRRIYPTPFRAHFEPGTPGYDPDLARKLATQEALERGALLGLMGLVNLLDAGGTLPVIPDMAAEIEEIKKTNSSVLRWVEDDCITPDVLVNQAVRQMYNRYYEWCKESGEGYPMVKRTWSKSLLELATFGNVQTQARAPYPGAKKERTFVLKN